MLCVLWLGASAAFGQGTILFDNRPPQVNAPVTLANGQGPGPSMVAGIFLVQNNSLDLVATTPFRTGSDPRVLGYFVPVNVTVPGVPINGPATFRVRVWSVTASSYEDAVLSGICHGEFNTVSGGPNLFVPRLGDPDLPGGQPLDTVFLEGLAPLQLDCIPEPGTLAILLFGAFLLCSHPWKRLPG